VHPKEKAAALPPCQSVHLQNLKGVLDKYVMVAPIVFVEIEFYVQSFNKNKV